MKKSNEKNNNPVSKPEEKKIWTRHRFSIVDSGSRVRGFDSMEQIIENVLKNRILAYGVIQHPDPEHAEIMPGQMQRNNPMKAGLTICHSKVQPDHGYEIPPNRSISLLNRNLYLFEHIEKYELRIPN